MDTIQDAYRIVYNDILNKDIKMFFGEYDAKNSNAHYMNGICTVMEFIAAHVSPKDAEDYINLAMANMAKSQKKALDIK